MKKSVYFTILCLTAALCFAGCGSDNSGNGNISDNGYLSDNSLSEDALSGDSSQYTGGSENADGSNGENTGTANDSGNNAIDPPEPIEYTISGNQTVRFSSYDLTDTYDEASATLIQMSDMEVTITGAGADIENNKIIIYTEGTYLLEGNLSNGQIYVNAGDRDKVHLVFNGIDIFCNTSAPVYIENADKTLITLAEGTVNTLTDSRAPLDDSANGCLYSKDDLTINGTGTLIVNGNYNNAISCKDDLKIVNGTYQITAVNNGLKGNDSIAILTCTMDIESMDDGCKVSNDTDSDKGYLFIADGIFNITANDDCFQSTRLFVIQGGHVLARCYGKLVNCDGYSEGAEEYIDEWV